jgi:hypothetical protein
VRGQAERIMILLSAVLLLLVFSVPFVPLRSRSEGVDVLSPVRLAALLHLVTVVPLLFLAAGDPAVILAEVRNHQHFTDLEVVVVKFALLQTVAFACLAAGVGIGAGRRLAARLPVIGYNMTPKRTLAAAVVAFGVGVFAFVLLIRIIGGYEELLINLAMRTKLLEGRGYLASLLTFLVVGMLLMTYALGRWNPAVALPVLLVVGLIVAFALSSFGGRKLTLHALVFAGLAWHYGVRRLTRLWPKALLVGLAVIPYFVAIPLIRSGGGYERYRSNIGALSSDIRQNISLAVTDLSYVHQHLFVVSYFRPDNIWWGRVYGDLITAPIPSSLYPGKPPVDDGMYLRTLADGQHVRPSMPRESLYQSSWPPETFGTMFMNFWIPGVIVGLFLLGVVYRTAYEYMKRSDYSLFSVLVYGHVMVNFHFSNLRIVQAITTIASVAFLMLIFFGGGNRDLRWRGLPTMRDPR